MLLHRDAFAGNWALIERTGALGHHPIDRQPFARAHQHGVAQLQFANGEGHFGLSTAHASRFGAQVGQRFNGAAGAFHGKLFQGAAQGKEKEQQRSFFPFADGGSAKCSGDHEKINIELAMSGLFNGAHQPRIAAGRKGK